MPRKTDFTNVRCYQCGRDKLTSKTALREYDDKGNWSGKWLCRNCRCKDYQKFNPNSQLNTIKLLRDRRINNLDPSSSQAIGDLFEELTCRWRGVKNLNKENDNFLNPIDHSPDSEGNTLQTKGRLDNHYRWNFSYLEREWDKEFDYEICYCASEDGKTIERIYKFPKLEIMGRKGIAIYKNAALSRYPWIRCSWVEKYRITDEDELKKVNDIWREIIRGDVR